MKLPGQSEKKLQYKNRSTPKTKTHSLSQTFCMICLVHITPQGKILTHTQHIQMYLSTVTCKHDADEGQIQKPSLYCILS